jgi:CDP-glycerol glycerophosphotransferase (TagB/SpsB family)
MPNASRRHLFFVEEDYSFEVLRPLQDTARRRGDEVAWFLNGPPPGRLRDDEIRLRTVKDVQAWKPDAVYAPGNEVPLSFPGLKVHVFHGMGLKKGHFRIRGMFDLYCTFGPKNSVRFRELAAEHGWFKVVETGWPKMDPLLAPGAGDAAEPGGRLVLYAPTFSPSLTSAPALAGEIARVVAARPEWRWIVKFHPKMEDRFADPIRAIRAPNFEIAGDARMLPLLRKANLMLTDTSSAAAEFMLAGKPVLAFRNRAPGPQFVNLAQPGELEAAIAAVFAGDDPSREAREEYARQMHPWRDGRSSERVLAAVDDALEHGLGVAKRKPLSLLRRFKYWRELP